MARYNEIKSIEELDAVQRRLKEEIKSKGQKISNSISDVQSFYKPANIVTRGLRSVTEGTPIDIYLINMVRRFIAKRSE